MKWVNVVLMLLDLPEFGRIITSIYNAICLEILYWSVFYQLRYRKIYCFLLHVCLRLHFIAFVALRTSYPSQRLSHSHEETLLLVFLPFLLDLTGY